MRKGNKTKVLIAVLALALSLNAFCLASSGETFEIETTLEFTDADTQAEEAVPDEALDASEGAAALQAADEAELQAEGDEEGVAIVPGAVFQYGDKYYRVVGKNIVDATGTNGGFDTNPNIQVSDPGSDAIYMPNGSYDTSVGHNNPGSVKYSESIFVWRHVFTTDKLYVLSAWFKLEGGINFNDNNRHVAGARDVITGTSHNVEIGRNIPKTGGWQQDLCVFVGNGGDNKFYYLDATGTGTIYVDDFVVYEVEEIESQLSIRGQVIENADSSFSADATNGLARIPSAGTYYHIVKYENEMPEEYYLTGVVALFKDSKLERIFSVNTKTGKGVFTDTGMEPASGTVDIMFEIPEGEDVSHYSYAAFLTDRSDPFKVLGAAAATTKNDPEDNTKKIAVNPVFVYGEGYGGAAASAELFGKDGE